MLKMTFPRLAALLAVLLAALVLAGPGAPVRAAVVEADDVVRSVDSPDGEKTVQGLQPPTPAAPAPVSAEVESPTTGEPGEGAGPAGKAPGFDEGSVEFSDGEQPAAAAGTPQGTGRGAGGLVVVLAVLVVAGASGFAFLKMRSAGR